MAKAPRPTRVRILGQTFRIRWVNLHDEDEHRLAGALKHNVGRANINGGHLGIAEDQSPDQVRETTLHEVLHALLLLTGHDREDDEHEVQAVAMGLLGWLRDNRALVAWLQER